MRKIALRAFVALALATVASLGAPSISEAAVQTETIYRLYFPSTLDHHYTDSPNEYNTLGSRGWVEEHTAWIAPATSSTPVYRLYYPATKDHHFTTSANEYNTLGTRGWVKEGIAWYGVAGNGAATPTSSTPIMGGSQASAERLAAYYRSAVGEKSYPSSVYTDRGAATIDDFARIVVEEANAEGVRAEVVFTQAMKETGWLRFGGAVKAEQCNFAGIGAVNTSPTSANSFSDVRQGIRAQVQHLKAYASTAPLANECVDPRFHLVKRGVAPTLEDLNGRWAVPGNGYGESIASMIDTMMALNL